MDFLTADIRQLYRKYLLASLGSALATSIYGFVDTIAVGQAVGPMGAAAIAVLNPFFSIMVFLAILCGIGGAVLMARAGGTRQRVFHSGARAGARRHRRRLGGLLLFP